MVEVPHRPTLNPVRQGQRDVLSVNKTPRSARGAPNVRSNAVTPETTREFTARITASCPATDPWWRPARFHTGKDVLSRYSIVRSLFCGLLFAHFLIASLASGLCLYVRIALHSSPKRWKFVLFSECLSALSVDIPVSDCVTSTLSECPIQALTLLSIFPPQFALKGSSMEAPFFIPQLRLTLSKVAQSRTSTNYGEKTHIGDGRITKTLVYRFARRSTALLNSRLNRRISLER